MSNPSAPPPYEDRNPLYPGSPPQGGYGQPSVLPGGYPAYPAYPQPGYGHPAGYPQPMPPIHPMPMHYGPGQGYDGEERAVSESFGPGEWDDRKVRHTFIRKVYTIISIQLLVTVAIIAIFTFVKPVGDFVRRNLFVYYVSYAVFLATYLTLACCQGPRRRFPWNIILLAIFTLAMGFMTGTISSVYETKAVIIAMIITAVVSISVTIFCFQTKVDFTSCTGLFCVLGIVMMVTGIVTAIVLSFKYVSVLGELGSANLALGGDFLYEVLGVGPTQVSGQALTSGSSQLACKGTNTGAPSFGLGESLSGDSKALGATEPEALDGIAEFPWEEVVGDICLTAELRI